MVTKKYRIAYDGREITVDTCNKLHVVQTAAHIWGVPWTLVAKEREIDIVEEPPRSETGEICK